MSKNPSIISYSGREYIEGISATGVFEEKITKWIKDCKEDNLSKDDVLSVTEKVAEYRGTHLLVEEIKQRLN
jgi:hypothetical protein